MVACPKPPLTDDSTASIVTTTLHYAGAQTERRLSGVGRSQLHLHVALLGCHELVAIAEVAVVVPVTNAATH
jgi:hypothetical protein